jgi:energy-coupling factor transporter ATP-binding protein EcfA2
LAPGIIGSLISKLFILIVIRRRKADRFVLLVTSRYFFSCEATRFVYWGGGFQLIRNDFGFIRAGANRGAPFDMRTIDIFVSSFPDVQKEHVVAEQLIGSAAAEFNLPINVHYSNPLRGSRAQGGSIGRKDFADESALVLSACFWEYPEREENDFLEIPNTGLYDLVICILGSRLGASPLQQCVMPDGSRPRSATDYEVGWALYQSKQTPGCPGLHVYRSRAITAAPLEPGEQRENLFRHWDAVQEFCGAWEKDDGTGFRECCHDFRDLEEFEDLFRKHFREFLARRLNPAIPSGKTTRKVLYSGSNPFRGLDFFDFQHSAVYHGRTRAVGEVFDVLKTQAAAKKPFLLVLGPSGSGKSSLVRAGVLPLITRGATPAGTGPWRCALTRPGTTGDPFDTLADALLETSPEESGELASQLRKDPEAVAARIGEVTQLVLVVDQLEELFATFSPVIQQKYIAALCALANCQHVFIIATLRSDFYPHYRRFSGLTTLGGIYELQPPTPHGIGNVIQFRAQEAGLRFDRDPETNRSLDETILEAAVANPEPLPLLEHLLSRLYEKQLARKDGLLLWADYRALGGFHNALAQHAEFVFLNLKSDEQEALQFVIRELLVPSSGEDAFLNRRSVSYHDLVLHPQLNQRQRSGAKGLVDRLIKEGLLSAKIDPQQGLSISIPQEALLRRWPRLRELLSQDRRFLRMRGRLDASMKQKIGAIGAAAIAGLAIFGAFVGGERFNAESRRTNKEHDIRPMQQNTELDADQRSQLEAADDPAVQAVQLMRAALELRLKETEQKLQIAQQNADPAFALGTQLKKTEKKPQIAQPNADLAKSQRNGVEAELRKAQEEKAQLTQQTSNLPDNQRSAKKGTDPANELRSGRALTLDSPQNAEQGISTQGSTAPVQSANH